MLKGLKVNITKEKLDLSGITTAASSEDMDRDFQKLGSIIEDSKVLAAQNADKLDRIIESYKILRNSVTNSIKWFVFLVQNGCEFYYGLYVQEIRINNKYLMYV